MNLITGGVDTHVHIIGSELDYPMVPERRYTPGLASIESLQVHLLRQGLERAVIIQPSIYGFDNRCTLDALQALQNKARGVLVLPESITATELQAFDAQGARGIRLNIESTGNFSADDLAEQLQFWGVRLADIGWHIQVYAPMTWIAQCADVIAKLPVPVVLDHFALWMDADCASAQERTLLDLLATGNIYIKLSASYRQLIKCPAELAKLVHRFLFLRSDRMLWGSDWPHTNREAGKAPTQVSRFKDIGADRLLDERRKWLDGSDWQQQILVDNPNQLYRF
jgi:predicted TIM-barrel fold metal-dependent hydrolase